MLLHRHHHRSASSADLRDAYTLSEAARTAYQKALSEHLPLAHIAEQSERPLFWFANSIIQIVEIFGKPPDETDHVRLTREIISELKLADDMMSLVAPKENKPRFVDLRVTKDDFERYMSWARTVY